MLFYKTLSKHIPRILSKARYTYSTTKHVDLKGVMPPIVTNFTKNGQIDYQKMEKNMKHWNKFDFSGYVLFGSNGESCLIDPQTRANHIKTIKTLSESGNKKKILIAGVNAESTEAAIQQCHMFAETGADALLVSTPTFYKASLTHKALVEFYKEVSKHSPGPVIVYNMPANTGVDLTADTLLEISNFPNVIGVKDSGGDVAKLSRVVHYSPPTLQVLAGSAGFMLPAMAVGSIGCVAAIANVLCQEVIDLYQMCAAKEFSKAMELQARLVHPNAMVTRQFGVPGLKVAMEMFGFEGGPCRSPLQPLEPSQVEMVKAAFVKSGFVP